MEYFIISTLFNVQQTETLNQEVMQSRERSNYHNKVSRLVACEPWKTWVWTILWREALLHLSNPLILHLFMARGALPLMIYNILAVTTIVSHLFCQMAWLRERIVEQSLLKREQNESGLDEVTKDISCAAQQNVIVWSCPWQKNIHTKFLMTTGCRDYLFFFFFL